jgi:ureidoglycolate hydrolase
MAQVRMVRLEARPLTPDVWAPFGWLPVADTDPADGAHTLRFEWSDPHLNVIAHAYDEVEHTDGGAVCGVMYRHATHTQALVPLNVDAVIAVAPAALDFSEAAHLGGICAFALHPQDTLVLHQGTWHWGPFPVGPEPVQLLNVQGLRYAEDNASVDLAERTGAVLAVFGP